MPQKETGTAVNRNYFPTLWLLFHDLPLGTQHRICPGGLIRRIVLLQQHLLPRQFRALIGLWHPRADSPDTMSAEAGQVFLPLPVPRQRN